jgi:dephospho-CoA kinase
MIVLGLTGSIGMGKSTAGQAFRRLGVPVHDADAEVHARFSADCDLIARIARAFPSAVTHDGVDRRRLGQLVFEGGEALARLEAIVHPVVRAAHRRFLATMARRDVPLCVLDIPLLYETGGEDLCDYVAVVSAPDRVQRERVLRRPGMTAERLRAVLARQLPDADKRRLADFVIHTGLGRDAAFRTVRRIVAGLAGEKGWVWSPAFGRG